ncbi:MAG: Calvin cycle protein CP12 [Leptolyngbyaceae bacterium]|nr:Calvin cycle protein CP12 [Leptolyngbyaceae bacterium]
MAYVTDRPIAFDIDARLQEALDQARSACTPDANAPECAIAWDTVEEIQAEIAHKRQGAHKNSLESYCDSHPDADECRVYDV